MANALKIRIADAYAREFADSEALLFVGVEGIAVAEMGKLRAALGEKGVRVRVVKNTIARRALAAASRDAQPWLRGPTAVLYGDEDGAATAARVLRDARRLAPKLEARGGLLGRIRLGPDEIQTLAELPSRETLLSELLGTLLGPASAIASVLEATVAAPARLTRALEARRETEPAPAPPATAEGADASS